ncbi:hypothetical protein [Hymenobacter wooponensis]|uniref:FCP1 homology domain-containing protein n=1 Tax=Hymenobacter wooponensis TaxID=1525360 RepID=A0A4Z0MQW4_9BACT|nr:hypothetical protein [Hymenobacter wooponensis]TGD81738.1 hypothetical protein EU557_09390 [Hymenobacter wooponensis]
MIRLYLDIDGVLLTKRNTQSPDFGAEFIVFVTQYFDCYWLTTHCRGLAHTAVQYLASFYGVSTLQHLQAVKATMWETLKTEAIDFSTDFYWLEDAPFKSEQLALHKHGLTDRLLLVDLDLDKAFELRKHKMYLEELLTATE